MIGLSKNCCFLVVRGSSFMSTMHCLVSVRVIKIEELNVISQRKSKTDLPLNHKQENMPEHYDNGVFGNVYLSAGQQ
jgi:hypothetical protein